jgi:hypothetical protein
MEGLLYFRVPESREACPGRHIWDQNHEYGRNDVRPSTDDLTIARQPTDSSL